LCVDEKSQIQALDRNIAAVLRRNARDATRVPPLLGITSP
jgi:hypothetical protein